MKFTSKVLGGFYEAYRTFVNLLQQICSCVIICLLGVADQLQTNYAGDLRNILKSVFDMNSSSEPDEIESVGTKFDRTQHIQAQLQAARVNRYRRSNSNHSHRSRG